MQRFWYRHVFGDSVGGYLCLYWFESHTFESYWRNQYSSSSFVLIAATIDIKSTWASYWKVPETYVVRIPAPKTRVYPENTKVRKDYKKNNTVSTLTIHRLTDVIMGAWRYFDSAGEVYMQSSLRQSQNVHKFAKFHLGSFFEKKSESIPCSNNEKRCRWFLSLKTVLRDKSVVGNEVDL